MGFIKKFQKDKKFRTKTILFFVAVILIFGELNMGEKESKKTWTDFDTCDGVNSWSCGILEQKYWTWEDDSIHISCLYENDFSLCESYGCVVAEVEKFGFNPDVCVPYGLNPGNDFLGIQEEWIVESRSDCKSGCGDSVGDGKYKCLPCGPSDDCNGQFQKTLADMLEGIWPGAPDSCQQRFYIMAFGGGLLAMVLILSAI